MFFSSNKDVQYLSAFQLYNLTNNQVSFLPISLSEKFVVPDEFSALKHLLKHSNHADVPGKVVLWAIDRAHPIVLIDEQGKAVVKVYNQLCKLDFENVYVLQGGITGLDQFVEQVLAP